MLDAHSFWQRCAALIALSLLHFGCADEPAGRRLPDATVDAQDVSLPEDSDPLPTFDVQLLDLPTLDSAIDVPAVSGDVTADGRVCADMERCDNGIDDDCDGDVDEGCACIPGTSQRCYTGPEGARGVGACVFGMQSCEGMGQEFGMWGACAGSVLPSGELCDGVDNDCNGTADNGCNCREGDTRACYTAPAATRSVGTCRDGRQPCVLGMGGVGSNWGACAGEAVPVRDVCDGFDNDCNGTVDDGCVCRTGETRSCYGGPMGTSGVGRCRGGTQTCVAPDGGTAAWGACTGQSLPATEVCDGVDNDCDGTIDNGCACRPGETRSCYSGPMGTRGVGPCAAGMQPCVAGAGGVGSAWGACTGERLPTAEVCDGADNNCNGATDEVCMCRTGQTRSCYTGPAGTSGVGACRAGSQGCVVAGGAASWGACSGTVIPAVEACDGVDNNCNGAIDDGCACRPGMTQSCYTGPSGTSGVGLCRAGSQSCVAGTGGAGSSWGMCTGAVLPAAEVCDTRDNNCNGVVDEGSACGPSVTCPAGVTAPAGTTVMLTATAMGAVSYQWTVVSGPMGGAAMFGSPSSPSTSFTSVIVGVFRLRFTATDAMGRTASCMTTVTMQAHGLRVELTWDTGTMGTAAGRVDLDLHLHNIDAPAWFTVPYDVFYLNTAPDWNTPGTPDDPSLDTDNIYGFGPENIRVDSPAVGAQTYTIGVHNYTGNVNTTATVRVYCGATLAGTYTHAVTGAAAAGANGNDFWRVARVTFTTPSACTVTPVNDIVTFLQARMGQP